MRAIINTDLQYHFGGNARTNFLSQGQNLLPNDKLVSPNGLYQLVYQGDGNLVLYDYNGQAYWATQTNTANPGRLSYQTDGNLCVYDSTGRNQWATMVYNYGGGTLTLQNNGNLVIYKTDNTVAWQSNSVQHPPPMTRNILLPDDKLIPGDMLVSKNKMFRLVYQQDCNLVLYDWNNGALWSSGTVGRPIGYAIMQTDGNFCIYANGGGYLWSFTGDGSKISAGSTLVLQDDGNVVVTDLQGKVHWATNTVKAVPAGAVPVPVGTTPQCGIVAQANGGVASGSICGGVLTGTSGCGGVIAGIGMCGAVYSGASFCGMVANGVSACGADTSTIGVCGVVAAIGGAAIVGVAAVGACAAVATIASLCGAVLSGAGASAIGASGAGVCGAVACGAAACGADVGGAEACVESKGAGVCGANATGAEGAGVCGLQVGFCGAVLCVALPIGGNW